MIDTNYYFLANVASKLIGLLVIPVVARMVSVEDFAIYDLFLVIYTILILIVTLGIDSGIAILITEHEANKQKISFYFVFSIILGVVLAVVLYLIAFAINIEYIDDTVLNSLFLYLIFNIFSFQSFNFLRWTSAAKKAAFLTFFSSMFSSLLGLLFISFENKIEFFIYGMVIGSFISALFAVYLTFNYIKLFKLHSEWLIDIKELLKLSLPFVPNYLGNNLIQLMDRLVILLLFTSTELGYYAILVRIAQIPLFIYGNIASGFTPIMFKNYTNDKGISLIKNMFRLYFLSSIPVFFIFLLLSDYIILLFGGEKYLTISYLLPIAIVSMIFVNGTIGSGFGYTIKRKTVQIVYITFVTVIVSFILSYILGIYFGLWGILLGTFLSGIFRVILHINYSERLYRFGYDMKLFYIISLLLLFFTFFTRT